mmetsp:Transcript_361/g.535  ORF Transcript_361/g.535 Transcript_361/m.535 type:complete len:237 (+) Transcript_361:5-715(+)
MRVSLRTRAADSRSSCHAASCASDGRLPKVPMSLSCSPITEGSSSAGSPDAGPSDFNRSAAIHSARTSCSVGSSSKHPSILSSPKVIARTAEPRSIGVFISPAMITSRVPSARAHSRQPESCLTRFSSEVASKCTLNTASGDISSSSPPGTPRRRQPTRWTDCSRGDALPPLLPPAFFFFFLPSLRKTAGAPRGAASISRSARQRSAFPTAASQLSTRKLRAAMSCSLAGGGTRTS